MQGAERRQLTLMFCDLVGSTALSNQLDPEDLRDLLAAYQTSCAAAVASYNGFIANDIGDGLLIYFGYPVAHEDDAERALLAALDIIEAIAALNAEYRADGANLEIRVRIGIATGLVVVGDTARQGAAPRDTVTGDAANLASRLQEAAQPNTILVSALTRQLAADRFEYHDLGERTLKGFPTPIPLHQVVRERLVTRFEARSATLTPFVGRETEMASLLAAWHDAQTTGSQVILIAGEAGLGKSRLATELRDRVRQLGSLPPDTDNASVIQCSPHHVHTILHPLVKHLERLAHIRREDSPATRLAKLRTALAPHTARMPEGALETVAALLGAAPPDSVPPTTAAATRQRIIDAFTAWLTALATGPARIITVEDVQWIDPTSRTVLARLAGALNDIPALLVITLRPTGRLTPATFLSQTGLSQTGLASTTDPAAPQITTLDLRPLDILSARRLAGEVPNGAGLTRPQLAAVLDRSEGIPLYIEELTKTAVKGLATTPHSPGSPAPDLLPDAINDTLMAQLDQLGPAKRIVQLAAVVGQEFSATLLAAVAAKPPPALEDDLRRLIAAGIIVPGPKYTDQYRFRHGLICDIAYRSLLRKSRRQVHLALAAELLRTAETSEPISTPNADSNAPAPDSPAHDLIARHFSLGHQPAAAVQHWQLGARAAIARSAHEEATGMLDAALADYEKQPGPPQPSLKIDLLLAMAVALRASRGYSAPEVEQKLREARALCEQSGDNTRRFNVEWGLFQSTVVGGDIPAAERIAHSLYRHAERHPDRPLVDAFLANGMVAQQLGAFARAATLFESGIAASQLETDPPRFYTHGQNPGLFCLSYLARTQCFLGAIETARASIARALAIAASRANDPGHIYGHVNALLHAVRVYNLSGDYDAEERLALETMRLAERNQFAYYKAQATCHLAWVTGARENLPLGIAQLETAIAGLSQTGTELGLTGFYALLAQLYLRARRHADAARTLEHATTRKHTHLRIWDAELERVRADILAQSPTPDPAAAEAAYRRSLAVAQRQRAGLLTLRTALAFGAFLHRTGRPLEARDLLTATLAAQPQDASPPAAQPPITQSVRSLLDRIVCDTSCLN